MKKRKYDINRIITIAVRAIFIIEFAVGITFGILNKNGQSFMNAFISVVGLMLTFIPETVERALKRRVRFSSFLKCTIVLFIFAAEFLGEIKQYYYTVSWWDTMLHSISGVILALIGFMLVNALNSSERIAMHLSPGFIALFAFTFALASGAIWEIFEFSGDRLLGLDMQKYQPIAGVLFETLEDGSTSIVYSQAVDWTYDAGLIDTMGDIICDFLSALAVSVLGYISLKTRNHYHKKKTLLETVLPADFPLGEANTAEKISDESSNKL